jgi:hypothetical protein
MHFVDPLRQGRFEALVRDLGEVPLLEASQAVADGRVRLRGAPYVWEAEDMVHWLDDRTVDRTRSREERERVAFTYEPSPSSVRVGSFPSAIDAAIDERASRSRSP